MGGNKTVTHTQRQIYRLLSHPVITAVVLQHKLSWTLFLAACSKIQRTHAYAWNQDVWRLGGCYGDRARFLCMFGWKKFVHGACSFIVSLNSPPSHKGGQQYGWIYKWILCVFPGASQSLVCVWVTYQAAPSMSVLAGWQPVTRTAWNQPVILMACSTPVSATCIRLGKPWPTWATARYVTQEREDKAAGLRGYSLDLEKHQLLYKVHTLLLLLLRCFSCICAELTWEQTMSSLQC